MRAMMLFIAGVVSLGAIAASQDGGGSAGQAESPAEQAGVRFVTVDVFIDSGESALAAYQVEVRATSDGGRVLLAGIEGGEHAAFAQPAHYDPRALHAGEFDHVVLAAFSIGEELPRGRTRVATLHYQAPVGEVALEVRELVAGDSGAKGIEARAEAVVRDELREEPGPTEGDDP